MRSHLSIRPQQLGNHRLALSNIVLALNDAYWLSLISPLCEACYSFSLIEDAGEAEAFRTVRSFSES
jgi:hypothetical protein